MKVFEGLAKLCFIALLVIAAAVVAKELHIW
jgi:hypothetical protein